MSRPSPFKGLASFEDSEADARIFFGREREREIIVANLLASRLTVLYGDTGVGKSSVLRAGVARDLRALPEPLAVVVFDDWRDDPAGALDRRVADATGAEPQGRLADTLELGAALVGGEVFVILDAFEQESLYHASEAGPGSFLDEFSEAATRAGLRASFLLAVREDALAKLDRFKSRVPNVFGNYLRLDHLDRTAAREAILGPIDRYNESAREAPVAVEPELVEAVLDQVAAGKVDLGGSGRGGVEGDAAAGIEAPFLQLVMERLWEAEASSGSDFLRLETLSRLGGAEQIVRDHLETALEALEPNQRDVAAAVFNHLVTPSGTKIAHDAADLAGYVGVARSGVEPVLASLADQRILRPVPGVLGSDLPRYEIYHDILADAVLAWRARHQTRRELARVREAAAARHRRLTIVAAAAVLLAGLMAGVTIFAFAQRSEADAQRRTARAHAFEASALGQLSSDPELSLLLAREAAKLDRGSRRAEDILRQALLAARERRVFPANDKVTVARFLPGGRIVVAGRDGLGRVYDTRAHRRRPLFQLRQRAAITAGDVDAPGNVIALGDEIGNVKLWSARDGSMIRTFSCGAAVRTVAFDAGAGRIVAACGRAVVVWTVQSSTPRWKRDLGWPVTDAIFSPASGPLAGSVAAIGHDPHVVVLDAATGSKRKTFSEGGYVESVAFSPGGGFLAAGGTTSVNAHIWNLRTGTSTELPDTPAVGSLAFAPNGATLATASLDGTARTWVVSSGARYGTMTGHTGGVTSVSFSRDAKLVLTASSDHTARIWTNTDSPDMVAVLAGHRSAVTAASFSRSGSQVLTGSDDHTARLWDASRPTLTAKRRGARAEPTLSNVDVALAGPGRFVYVVRAADGRPLWKLGLPEDVAAARIAPDGKMLAAAAGAHVYLFGLPGRRLLAKLSQPAKVTAIAFSAHSKRLATGGADHVARIWMLFRGDPVELKGHHGRVTGVAFSRNGRMLATSSNDGTAIIWDVRTGRPVRTLAVSNAPVLSVAFSPDGHHVVTAGAGKNDADLWNAANGALEQVLHWHFSAVRDAEFSPDGRWIATITAQSGQLWRVGGDGPLFQFGIVQPGTGKSFAKLTSVAFDPTGRVVLIAADDGALRTYACEVCGGISDMLRLAGARVAVTGRTLSRAEKKLYGG